MVYAYPGKRLYNCYKKTKNCVCVLRLSKVSLCIGTKPWAFYRVFRFTENLYRVFFVLCLKSSKVWNAAKYSLFSLIENKRLFYKNKN